jgi:hypothetical protein
MMRFFAYVLLAAAAAAGCGETAASTPPGGGGSDGLGGSGGIGGDGGSGGIGGDGGVGGSGGRGGVDGSWCTTSAGCPACPDPSALCDGDPDCAVGEVCLSTGCDDFSRCFVIGGGVCKSDGDCGNPAYECNSKIERCLRINPGCDDSNDCVAGFACESNTCVDRRVPCKTGSDCPHGFTCFFPSADQRFCRRITRPCGDDLDCLVLGVPCGDVDGDGKSECMPSITPNTPGAISCDNTQCTEEVARVCETNIEGLSAVCGQHGLCSSLADCVDGFECRDLWGDGRAECVLPAEPPGSCVDSSKCSIPNVCASPRAGGPPTCVGGAAM